MPFKLSALPYSADALAPHMSVETLNTHHDKHHRAYVDTLNKLVQGKPEAAMSLEAIILSPSLSSPGPMFNNAAQIWNHDFFWKGMKPNGGGEPTGALAQKINQDFGSSKQFAASFSTAAAGHFGSGWTWLVLERGKLAVTTTANADLPMKHDQKALLALDIWEHAYYIDHRNERPKYIEAFLSKLVNWNFALENLTSGS